MKTLNLKLRRKISYLLLSVMVLFSLHSAFAFKTCCSIRSAIVSVDNLDTVDNLSRPNDEEKNFHSDAMYLRSAHQGRALQIRTACKNQSSIQNSTLTINENPFKYSGYYCDSRSGLYYLHARYYSPRLMRFINRDSCDLSNRYAYCNGQPVSQIDPTGHMPKWLGAVIAGVGTAIGIALSIPTGGCSLGVGLAWAGTCGLDIATAGTTIASYYTNNKAEQKTLSDLSLGLGIAAGVMGIASGGWKLYNATRMSEASLREPVYSEIAEEEVDDNYAAKAKRDRICTDCRAEETSTFRQIPIGKTVEEYTDDEMAKLNSWRYACLRSETANALYSSKRPDDFVRIWESLESGVYGDSADIHYLAFRGAVRRECPKIAKEGFPPLNPAELLPTGYDRTSFTWDDDF